MRIALHYSAASMFFIISMPLFIPRTDGLRAAKIPIPNILAWRNLASRPSEGFHSHFTLVEAVLTGPPVELETCTG
ncbi:hypothetical protein BX600DRAFT_475874 [Xylariales sp. PMI_506]|nr:hypothetical protein BX600DRAFT_475874 [Xylariales sp. PMI_506]